MSDSQKYYYMRLKEDFFWTENILILEGLPDGMKYSNILLKMYLKSLKDDGKLVVNNFIPYDIPMLSAVTNHDESTVRCALEAFQKLGLIEVLDNGAIYMLNIQQFIGKSSTEADRIREYRAEIAAAKAISTKSVQMYDKCTPEIEKEIEIEIEKEIEIEIDSLSKESVNKVDYQSIVDAFNNTCKSLPKVTKLTDKRKTAIKRRLKNFSEDEIFSAFAKVEESDFCTGKNNQNWKVTFDWLFCNDSNMTKVLEGNYDNKGKTKEDLIDEEQRESIYDVVGFTVE